MSNDHYTTSPQSSEIMHATTDNQRPENPDAPPKTAAQLALDTIDLWIDITIHDVTSIYREHQAEMAENGCPYPFDNYLNRMMSAISLAKWSIFDAVKDLDPEESGETLAEVKTRFEAHFRHPYPYL